MKSRETQSMGGAGPPRRPAGAADADGAPDTLDERMLSVLSAHGVPPVEQVNPSCFRLKGVPMAPEFSKPRANILLRREPRGRPGAGAIQAFVDEDLAYTGANRLIAQSLGAVTVNGWRAVLLPPMTESLSSALCRLLEVLDSPVAADARQAIGEVAAATGDGDPMKPVLAMAGEAIPAETVQRAYETTFRQALADELAAGLTRAAVPRSAVLWGPTGSGHHHLLLAAGWPLLCSKRIRRVLRVSGARLAAGCIFGADVDASLLKFLSEAVASPDTLILVRDLDLALTGSGVGYSLLRESLDSGLAMLATASSEAALVRLGSEPAVARRLWAVRLGRPSRDEVLAALGQFAASSPVPVAPSAIQAALSVTQKAGGTQPAAAISLLAAAIAKAVWRGGERPQVDPDDVLAVPPSQWPEETWQKD
ncbi:MAG: hypothetical protein NTX87_15175 [Planctomycetota bacterium]|nr:hypothetical protein [Planctomycetota bacterium]